MSGPSGARECRATGTARTVLAAMASLMCGTGCGGMAAERQSPSYPAWIAGTDFAASGLFAGGAAAEYEPVMVGGASLYILGGPLVHLAHRNAASAEVSAWLRGAAPSAGAVAGYMTGHAICDEVCATKFAYAGIGLGAVSAAVLDALLLTRSRQSPEHRERLIRVGGTF